MEGDYPYNALPASSYCYFFDSEKSVTKGR